MSARKPGARDPFGAASHRFEAAPPVVSTTPEAVPEPATRAARPARPPRSARPIADAPLDDLLADYDEDPLDAASPTGDPLALSALLAELQATAEQLGAQLGDLGRAGRDAAAARSDQLPILKRVLELAPPELRARLTSAATMGLSATRDLADWLLAQMAPHSAPPEPEELVITPLDDLRGPDA